MEEIKIFSIFDLKSQTFSSLICDTRASLDEYLKFVVNDSKSSVADFSSDFVLYELGDFDIITGHVSVLGADKKAICSLSDYKIYSEAK